MRAVCPMNAASKNLIDVERARLAAAGYPTAMIDAALKRASAATEVTVRPIRLAIRELAYYDVLQANLRGAERWIAQTRRQSEPDYQPKNGVK